MDKRPTPASLKKHNLADHAARREFARLWRDPGLNDLELLHARFLTTSFAPHTHDTYAIGIVESGAESFAYRGEDRAAGAGTICMTTCPKLSAWPSWPN